MCVLLFLRAAIRNFEAAAGAVYADILSNRFVNISELITCVQAANNHFAIVSTP